MDSEQPPEEPGRARRGGPLARAATGPLAAAPDAAATEILRKPVNALAIVPQSKRITPLFRKSYNVMLYLAQEQGIEKDIYRAPLAAVLSGLDFDSNDTALVKRHLRAMATTAVEWQSPTTGEGASWAVSGLIGHAEIKRERGQNWLEWSYSVKLKQELLEPTVFARLSIGIISQLRSHGGIALYEICSRYREVGRSARQHWSWWRPVLSGKPEDERQKKLEYRFFKRDVLKPAIAEVNAVSDLIVELVEHREGRFTSDLQFLIRKKALTPPALPPTPAPVDLSLVARARDLGVDDEKGEQLLYAHGEAALRQGLDALARRLASPYPEPLRDPYRYLKSLMPGEGGRAEAAAAPAAVATGEGAAPPDGFTAREATRPPPTPQSRQVQAKRQARWIEEWLRRRREQLVAEIDSLGEAAREGLVADLLVDMRERNVHPSIIKRLQTSGWQHPMVLHEMVRFYAQGTLGEHWDKPSTEALLEIASELGDSM